MTAQELNSQTAAANAQKPPTSRSLNVQIQALLLDCPSRQAFFERVLKISTEQFSSSVGRVDYHVGDTRQSQMTHDPRMAPELAVRFDAEYVGPLAESILQSAHSEPQLKRFERGNQSMTLISAPIMDITTNKPVAAITLMLGGGKYKPEVVLPRLDGISALASAILVNKTQSQNHAQPGGDPQAAVAVSASAMNVIQETNALAKASQFQSTKEFGYSIVNSLCVQLQAEQVAFGVEQNQRISVEAISGLSFFKASSPGVAIVRQAMEECLDSGRFVSAQNQKLEGQGETLPIHEQWSTECRNSSVLSIPLKNGDQVTGVISVRRSANKPFQKDEVAGLVQLLSPYGSAIRVVEQANRSLGTQLSSAVRSTTKSTLQKGSVGRKVVVAGLLLGCLWFLFGTMTYRPICRTRVIAADLRHIAAPFDGKLKSVLVRPGQEVLKGDLLVEFDTADLRLELNGLLRQISSTQVEVRQSISEDNVSAAALARSQVEVLQTRAEAVSKRIQDAQIQAPADGTVVISDLEQRVGQVFPQGEEILQFATDGEWLLEIEIPDDIASCVAAEQTGTFAAASYPTEKQSFKIRHIDGGAVTVQDRNVFMAHAPLEARPSWMKTGMEGTARIQTVSRPVWWVALHRLVDWGRMNFWI